MSESSLSEQERQLLIAGLAELKSRGQPISKRIRDKLKQQQGQLSWPVDSRGYFSRNDGRQYNPKGAQEPFILSQSRFAALIGGRGSGKSGGGAQKALRKIYRGESGAVISPDFEHMKTSTWPELREWIPWEMVVPRQRIRKSPAWEPQKPFTIVFLNGARMTVKGLKDPESARGPNINWLWYDEAGKDDTGLAWRLAIAGVRIGKDPQAWITTTPKGKEHWIYKFFVVQDFPQEALDMLKEVTDRSLVELYTVSIEDNKENLDPAFYAATVAAYPPGWMKSRELDGIFVDEGGVLGHTEWFNGHIIFIRPAEVKKRLRYWDLAASEKKILKNGKFNDPDETVGTLLSWDGNKQFYIEDQVYGLWEWEQILDKIFETALRDTVAVPIYLEQEPASGGKNQVAAVKMHFDGLVKQGKMDRNFRMIGHKPEGDKIIRANYWFAEAAQGQFWMVQGPWNDGFLSQLSSFPLGRHDDRIDGVSGARMEIAPIAKWKNVPFLAV